MLGFVVKLERRWEDNIKTDIRGKIRRARTGFVWLTRARSVGLL
jgi:hypothetical protein